MWLASISNGLEMELEVKFSSRLGRILSLKIMWQCHVDELILENLFKGQCCVFAPYGGRYWYRDPPLFRSHLVVQHSRSALFPSFLHPIGSRLPPSLLYRTPLFPCFFFFWGHNCLDASSSSESPPLLLFPPSTQARAGSAPWLTLSPPRDSPMFPFHSASTSWRAARPPLFATIRCLALPLHPHPPSNLKQSYKIQSFVELGLSVRGDCVIWEEGIFFYRRSSSPPLISLVLGFKMIEFSVSYF